MNLKPNNFYIGLIDLFAILLPGALLGLLLYFWIGAGAFEGMQSTPEYSGFVASFLFLLAAYLLGHVIMWLGSYLDQLVYDPLKNRIYPNQRHLALVKAIRAEKYPSGSEAYLNNFDWSRNRLVDEFTSGYEEVELYMVESKFFCALVIVLPLVATWTVFYQPWYWGVGFLVLWLVSIVRYFQCKQEAIRKAYKHVVSLKDKIASLFSFKDRNSKPREEETPISKNRRPDPYPTNEVFSEDVDFQTQIYLSPGGEKALKRASLELGVRQVLTQVEYMFYLEGKGMITLFTSNESQVEFIFMSPCTLTRIMPYHPDTIENKGSIILQIV